MSEQNPAPTVPTEARTTAPSTPTETPNRVPLEVKRGNWVTEPAKQDDRKAREMVVNAMGKDEQRVVDKKELTGDEVHARVKSNTEKLSDRMRVLGRKNLSFTRRDPATNEDIITEIEEQGGAWVAREKKVVGKDTVIISEARIDAGGSTSLTLNYEDQRYKDKNADLKVDSNPHYQEATTTAFNLLATETLKQNPQAETEKAGVERLKAEALDRLKSGFDAEGTKLYEAHKKSLSNGENRNDIARVYGKASWSSNNLETPAELNKLLVSMDSLYRQIGEPGYKPQIDVSKEIAGKSPKEQEQIINAAIQRQALKDFQDFPDKYAARQMEGYVDAKAKHAYKEQDLDQKVKSGNFSRSDIRDAAYGLAVAKMALLREVGRNAQVLGDDELGNAVKVGMERGWEYAQVVSLQPLDKDTKDSLVAKAKDSLSHQFGEVGMDRYAQITNGLQPGEVDSLFTPVAEVDHQIANKVDNIVAAKNSDPSKVCELASELKELQLKRKEKIAEVRIGLADKRVAEADAAWKKAREEAGKLILKKGVRGGIEAGVNLFKAGREWLGARTNRFGEQLNKNLEPAVNDLSKLGELTSEKFTAAANKIDSVLLGRLKQGGTDAARFVKDKFQSAQNKVEKIGSDIEITRIVLDKRLRDEIYAQQVWLEEQMAYVYTSMKGVRTEIGADIAGVVGGEEYRKVHKNRQEAITRLAGMEFKKKVDEIESRENPLLDVFKKDLRRRVKLIESTQETTTQVSQQPEQPPQTTAVSSAEAKSEAFKNPETLREKLVYQNVVVITDGDGNKRYILEYYDKNNKVHVQRVDENGNLLPGGQIDIKKAKAYQKLGLDPDNVESEEKAKEMIEAINQIERTNAERKKFQFETGYKFAEDNGKIVLVKTEEVSQTTETKEKKEVKRMKIEFAAESDAGKVRKLDEDSYFSGVKAGEKGSEVKYRFAENTRWTSEAKQKMPVDAQTNFQDILRDIGQKEMDAKDHASDIFANGVDGLFIVADGMGGHGAGETASQMAIEGILAEMAKTEGWDKLTPDQVKTKIKEAVQAGNSKVHDARVKAANTMGTTMTMALVIGKNLYTANVGDSRVYLYDDTSKDLKQLTTDHSLAQRYIDTNQLKPEDRYTFPQRNIIYRNLGDQSNVEVDVNDPVEISGKVKILTACDGLWEEAVDHDEGLKRILGQGKSSEEITKELIQSAKDGGGTDNITAVVAELEMVTEVVEEKSAASQPDLKETQAPKVKKEKTIKEMTDDEVAEAIRTTRGEIDKDPDGINSGLKPGSADLLKKYNDLLSSYKSREDAQITSDNKKKLDTDDDFGANDVAIKNVTAELHRAKDSKEIGKQLKMLQSLLERRDVILRRVLVGDEKAQANDTRFSGLETPKLHVDPADKVNAPTPDSAVIDGQNQPDGSKSQTTTEFTKVAVEPPAIKDLVDARAAADAEVQRLKELPSSKKNNDLLAAAVKRYGEASEAFNAVYEKLRFDRAEARKRLEDAKQLPDGTANRDDIIKEATLSLNMAEINYQTARQIVEQGSPKTNK